MRNFKSSFVAVPLLLLVSGCASVPMASKEDDAAAKTFRVPPDKGRIYVYRKQYTGRALKVPITLDGKLMGYTLKNTFLAFDVGPGTHEVGCIAETPVKATIDVKAGGAVYVWQGTKTDMYVLREMKMATWQADCALNVVDENKGRQDVSECSLVMSQ